MSYAKSQEYRMKKYLENHPDISDIKYYGSREKNMGDFKFIVDDRTIVFIDHKSTVRKDFITLQLHWAVKHWEEVYEELSRSGEFGDLPLYTGITFNMKCIFHQPETYKFHVLTYICPTTIPQQGNTGIIEVSRSKRFYRKSLPAHKQYLAIYNTFADTFMYILTLDDFIQDAKTKAS